MPGRGQALTRTRCPVCDTVFRVTSEQLRLKAGKVRCGQCQSVFNAFDHLVPEATSPLPEILPLAAAPVPPMPVEQLPDLPLQSLEIAAELTSNQFEPAPIDEMPVAPSIAEEPSLAQLPVVRPEPELAASVAVDDPAVPNSDIPEIDREPSPSPVVPEAPLCEPATGRIEAPALEETPEASTEAARAAGLVAVRELPETGSYNRWAAGTLAGGLGGFESEPPRHTGWLFALFAVVLGLGLVAQLLFHFRTDVVRKLPSLAAWYDMLAVDVPLPRQSELVAIDTSDLQSDNARGLFVLQATLHNRAPYAQAWPTLELTLTDTLDAVVSRRVLGPADYLPPATDAKAFPANGEVAVKLWLEARDIGAAGYRLYVFYP